MLDGFLEDLIEVTPRSPCWVCFKGLVRDDLALDPMQML
jgi:hypothetical protein